MIVLLIALMIRVLGINRIPDGFLGDEAALGYDAYAIATNGTDEYGRKFPLYFESIGDFKYPSYIYLSVPFIWIFGLNEFSTRLLSIISGSLSVLLVYLIVVQLTKKRLLGFFSAMMLALSPWHIFFSRGAFESNLGLFLSLLSGYTFLMFGMTNKLKWLVLTAISFILAIYAYPAYRIFLPLILLMLFISHYSSVKNLKVKYIGVVLVVVLIAINLISILPPESRVRAGGLIGSSYPTLNVDQAELELEDGVANPGQVILTRVFHNKIIHSALNYLGKYLDHFNPDFLFINGDKTRQIFNIPNSGLLYIFEIPLLLLGVLYLFSSYKKLFWFCFFWIIFGAIPSTLANELPSSVRFLASVPGFAMFSGAGLYYLAVIIKGLTRPIVIFTTSLIIFFIFFNIFYVYHQFTVHQTFYRPWRRDVGMKEMVFKVNSLQDKYENIVLPDDPYIFFLFYNRTHPADFLKLSTLSASEIGKWERVKKFGKIVFKMPMDCPKVGKVGVLYICKGMEVPKNSILVDAILYKDKVPAFAFVEFYPLSKEPKGRPPLPSRMSYMVDIDGRNDGVIPDNEDRLW